MTTPADFTQVLKELDEAEVAEVRRGADSSPVSAAMPTAELPTLDMEGARMPLAGEWLAHYRLDAVCGSGGMGVVYRGWDTALERPVAIKLLHRDLCSADWDSLRREATALMRLQHPNIANFYELNEQGSLAYIAMEYVEGVTLADQVERHGPFSGAALLELAEGLLCALGHAHSARVLHRDIKPANIMILPDGSMKLLDFGIAKLLHAPRLLDDAQHTRVNTVAGSPGYMAPEQLRAGELDERTDLFAVAAVLFFAATGEPAFPGESIQARIARTLTHREGDLAKRLPGPVGECLDGASSIDPDRRPASATAFLFALKPLLESPDGSGEHRRPRSLALLEPHVGPAAQDLAWLGKALNNALRPMLEQTGRFDPVPEAAVRAALDAAPDVDAVGLGQRLGARWVLHGELSREADSVALHLHLHDAGTAELLAERRVSAPLEEVFSLQAELARWVAERLAISPQPVEAQAWDEAEYCARGQSAFQRGGKDGLTEAAELFDRALELNPDSVAAHGGLAGVYAMSYTFTSDPALLERAMEHAGRALEVEAQAHEARTWMVYCLMRQHRAAEAMEHAQEIIARGGDSHLACYFAAGCHAEEGQFDSALALYQASIRQNPHRSWPWFGAGHCHAALGNQDSALWCFSQAVDAELASRDFNTAGCGAFLAETLRLQGRLKEAWEAGKEALERVEHSDFIYRDSFRALALCVLGRIALDRGKPVTAAAAFGQAVTGLRGRPSALGAGHLLVQALAGLAVANRDPALLDQAEQTREADAGWNFEWFWGCTAEDTDQALAWARATLASAPPEV